MLFVNIFVEESIDLDSQFIYNNVMIFFLYKEFEYARPALTVGGCLDFCRAVVGMKVARVCSFKLYFGSFTCFFLSWPLLATGFLRCSIFNAIADYIQIFEGGK